MQFDLREAFYNRYVEEIDKLERIVVANLQKKGLEDHTEYILNFFLGLISHYTNEMLIPVLEEYHQKLLEDLGRNK